MADEASLAAKQKKLEEIIKNCRRVVLAFSGGVDSSYLLAEAIRVLGPENVLAVTVSSELHPETETKEAVMIAGQIGAELLVLSYDLLSVAEVANNDADRCYYCKKALFTELIREAGRRNFNIVADGTNANDTAGHRPGMQALKELGVLSPLQAAGLGKSEIRLLAKNVALPNWNKPAAPCLATRFPVGAAITGQALKKVASAEAMLRELRVGGDLRVRVHNELLRIEVDPDYLEKIFVRRKEITIRLKKMGYKYVALDLEGYRMGSMEKPGEHKD